MKALFIDRDGTLLQNPPDEQIDSFEKFAFLPGVITALSKISAETDFDLVLVTNQDGLGTASFPEETFWPVQNMMVDILANEGVCFSEIYIDPTFPEDNAPTRKPGTAMLTEYLSRGVDLQNSFVIGDRLTDVEMAHNLSCGSIFIGNYKPEGATFATTDWNDIYRFLKAIPRTAVVQRTTKETDIAIELNIDGSGKTSISTGVGFFDHMLEQIPRHGNFDMTIRAKGDLQTGSHHLIEDIGIALGDCFRRAMGSKKGIERYGFTLPMDDCLSQVALDFGGRSWLVWNVEFSTPTIGDVDSEMFYHFFKSFSDSAKCNINIKAEGDNNHHKIEGIFKAFAKAAKMALKSSGNFGIPSTKGSI